MVLDYGGAWIAEIVLKYLFADNQPKVRLSLPPSSRPHAQTHTPFRPNQEMITRGSERREARRAEEERLKEETEDERRVAAFEKKDL